jgi:transmembrane sensor
MYSDEKERAFRAQRAASWRLQLAAGGIKERKMFVRWLRQSPLHVADMLREAELEFLLEHIDRDRKIDIDALLARHAPTVSHIHGADADVVAADEQVPPTRWTRIARAATAPTMARRWMVAAALCAVLSIGLLTFMVADTLFDRRIATEASEWRNMTLEDGSIVRLGPITRVRIEFNDAARFISLEQGEALFEVARDLARPFLVDAGAGTARALGTRFGVRRHAGGVLVTVAEGRVFVARRSDVAEAGTSRSVDSGVQLSAGQQIGVSAGGLTPVQHVDAEESLAWAHKRLIFRSETIAEAAAQFNRLNRVQVLIEDAAIGDRPIRGAFDADDPEGFATVVTAITRATVVGGDRTLRLIRDDAAPAAQAATR